jgi:hypothetical protein
METSRWVPGILAAMFLTAPVALSGSAAATDSVLDLDVSGWRGIPRESGPVNYYRVDGDPLLPFIHASYEPGYKTAVMGFEIPKGGRRGSITIWASIGVSCR